MPLHYSLRDDAACTRPWRSCSTTRQAPVYVVHFTQAAAMERAQALTSINVCTRAEKDAIAQLIGNFRFAAGFGRTLSRLVRHGIGVHHAGMLPKYRRLVETLAQAGLLKVICGTDTLGVGINVPIRTVLFTALSKYDGTKHAAAAGPRVPPDRRPGRAGRVRHARHRGGTGARARHRRTNGHWPRPATTRTQAPQGGAPQASRGLGRLGPTDIRTSDRVRTRAAAVQLRGESRHAAQRDCPPRRRFAAMRHLLVDNDEDAAARRRHIRRAIAIYRALLAGGVVERLSTPDDEGRTVRLTVNLQHDFALNQPLSPLALAAVDLLDRESPSYALDVLSVIESTLDNPRQVLSAQLFKAKGEAVAQMKADGIEYDQRMDLLESVTYPQPLVELLGAAYEMYRRGHPWVADHELAPKSVARDLFERAMTFAEYVGFYGLARSEGLVLRYLADSYKALRQTVPPEAHTEELADLIEWLGELVRQVDSSLLDEWERLRNPSDDPVAAIEERPASVVRNIRAFRVLVRNALFRRVTLAALRRYDELGALDGEDGWDADAWADALEPYFDQHGEIGTWPDARGPAMLLLHEDRDPWMVRQIIDDPAGDHDWGISAEVDLAASEEAGTAVVRITDVGLLPPLSR